MQAAKRSIRVKRTVYGGMRTTEIDDILNRWGGSGCAQCAGKRCASTLVGRTQAFPGNKEHAELKSGLILPKNGPKLQTTRHPRTWKVGKRFLDIPESISLCEHKSIYTIKSLQQCRAARSTKTHAARRGHHTVAYAPDRAACSRLRFPILSPALTVVWGWCGGQGVCDAACSLRA